MITVGTDNRATIPVEVPSAFSSAFSSAFGGIDGIRVRVDLAMSETELGEESPLWVLAGIRRTSGDVLTEVLPAGGRFWIRGRTEAPGNRPSAWTAAESFETGEYAALLGARAFMSTTGVPTICWRGNLFSAGLLVEYSIEKKTKLPTYSSSVEIDARDPLLSPFSSAFSSAFGAGKPVQRCYSLTALTVEADERLSARLTPYDGWSDPNVSGTAGYAVTVAVAGPTDGPVGSAFSSAFSTAFA